MQKRLELTGPHGQHHKIFVSIETGSGRATVEACYGSGDLDLAPGTTIARWHADYEPPIPGGDPGHVDIGQGQCAIEVDELRGLGLGSYFMSYLVCWVKQKPCVPVVQILLSASDASTSVAAKRRNRFWEKFGFQFDYQDNETWGESKPLPSHKLVDPDLQAAKGWEIRELFGHSPRCEHPDI